MQATGFWTISKSVKSQYVDPARYTVSQLSRRKMAGKDNNKFHFLPSVTSRARTSRDIELVRSDARSHLARIVHRERRQKASLPTAKSVPTSFASNSTAASQASAAGYDQVSLTVNGPSHNRQHAHLSSEDAAIRTTALAESDALRADLHHNEWSSDDEFEPNLHLDQVLSYMREEQSFTALAAQNSSTQPLSTYRPNAWTTISQHLSSLHSLRLFEYCGTRLWKGYNPGLDMQNHYVPLYAVARAASEADNSSYFNAQMWQAAIHLSIQEGQPITKPESFRYYQRALQMIAQDLTKPINKIDHTTIFGIFGLCLPEPKSFEPENNISDGFRSPFLELQWIGLLGRKPLVQNHLTAIFRIVELKGGIDMLNFFPITYGVQYLDVLQATFNLSAPRYPIAQMFQKSEISCNRDNLFGLKEFLKTEDPLNRIGETETPYLRQLIRYGLSKEIFEIMLDMRVWSRLLRRLRNEMNVKIGGSLLALRRNITQHRLLQTISTSKESIANSDGGRRLHTFSPTSLAITNMVRTGLLIFSVGVTFPVRYAPLYETLISKLQRLLRKHIPMLLEQQMYEFLIWLGMLGCLATTRAPKTDSKAWFINTICRAEKLRAQTWASQCGTIDHQDHPFRSEDTPYSLLWDRIKEDCLTPFVWNDDACNAGARLIWLEVQMQLAGTDVRNEDPFD